MKVIACLENSNGMMFNNRRVSFDSAVITKIMELTKGDKLWMSSYSASLFNEYDMSSINFADNALSEAADGEYCFVENLLVKPFEKWISEIIVFKWNRDYPSDFKFDIDLSEWNLKHTKDFKGNSHDKITMEVYVK